MKLEEIYLTGFIPFEDNTFKEFRWRPIDGLNVIIGTNGSGKSSLLRMCSPEPANPQEFRNGGIKENVYVNEQGTRFRVRSEIDKTSKHYFFIDDGTGERNLNTGNTITVQKELVAQYLRYDNLIHRLVTGTLAFTDMSPKEREKLLYRIADVDMSYVTSILIKSRTMKREAEGVYKFLKERIAEISCKLIEPEIIERMGAESEQLNSEIIELYPLVDSAITTQAVDDIANRVGAGMSQLDACTTEAIAAYEALNIDGFTSPQDVLDKRQYFKTMLGVKSEEARAVEKQLEELVEIQLKLEDCPDGTALEELIATQEELSNALSNIPRPELLVASTDYPRSINEIKLAIDSLKQLYADNDVCVRLFTREEMDVANKDKDTIEKTRHVTEHKLKVLEETMVHARAAKENQVVCPKCSHEIRGDHGRSDAWMIEAESDAMKYRTTLKALDKQEQELNDVYLLPIKHQLFMLGAVKNVKQRFPDLSPVFTEVGVPGFIASSTIGMDAMKKELEKVQAMVTIDNLSKEHKRISELVEVVKLAANFDLSSSETLEQKFYDLNQEVDALNKDISNVDKLLVRLKACADAQVKLANTYDILLENAGKLLDALKTQESNERLKTIQVQLTNIKKTLDGASGVRDTYDRLEEDLVEHTAKIKRLKKLETYLSPKTGVIGKNLRAVLSSFVVDINTFIERIWETKLDVHPYKSETELDFKFPVEKMSSTVPDIGMCSLGQKDIINLAVTFCAMEYIGLGTYPVFFDEVGSSFDAKHRRNFIMYINRTLETGVANQLFMVNHYYSEYGAFNSPDYVVLNESNVVKPSTYNRNVSLT